MRTILVLCQINTLCFGHVLFVCACRLTCNSHAKHMNITEATQGSLTLCGIKVDHLYSFSWKQFSVLWGYISSTYQWSVKRCSRIGFWVFSGTSSIDILWYNISVLLSQQTRIDCSQCHPLWWTELLFLFLFSIFLNFTDDFKNPNALRFWHFYSSKAETSVWNLKMSFAQR